MDGNLDSIQGRLILDGGIGDTVIELVDTADTNPSGSTTIADAMVGVQAAVQISGLVGPRDDVRILVIDSADLDLELRSSGVTTANEAFVIESTVLGQTRINDQQGNAQYTIARTRGPLQILGDAGNETVQVTPTSQDFGQILGTLSLLVGGGLDEVWISDQATEELAFYELTSNAVTRSPAYLGMIEFDDQLESMQLSTASVTDAVTIVALPAVTDVQIDQGGGDNIVVGPVGGTEWELIGANQVRLGFRVEVTNATTLASGGGSNIFHILSNGSVSGAIFGTPAGFDVLDYSDHVGPVSVDLSTNTATNVSTISYFDRFVGSPDSDLLTGPNAAANWTIVGPGQGTVQIDGGSHVGDFESFEQLGGGNGDDHFLVAPAAHLNSLSGGAGRDRINYALFRDDVSIDLLDGTATNLDTLPSIEDATGGAGNDTIRGNNGANVLLGLGGHDVLIGKAGNDVIEGGIGNDVLIGGAGGDTLKGGQHSDLLIAGSTIYDANPQSLNVIRSVWSDSTMSYGRRIDDLASSVSRVRLTTSSVFLDLQVDQFFGGGDDDWFWIDLGDIVHDRQPSEQLDRS